MSTVTFAVRGLLRHIGWAVLAVCVLAIGLAAVIATSSVTKRVNGPLPYQPEDRLFIVSELRPDDARRREIASNVIHRLRALEEVEASGGYLTRVGDRIVTADGRSQTVRTALVTKDFFDVLGVSPRVGRFFFDDESPGLVLSSSLWMSRFGADPTVVGRHVTRDGFVDFPVPILGVAPQPVSLPGHPECWSRVTLKRDWTDKGLIGIVRLAPDVTLQSLQSQLDLIAADARAAASEHYRGVKLVAEPLRSVMREDLTGLALALQTVSVITLVIGCLNFLALLMFRMSQRRTTLGLCSALGATRTWATRALLSEAAMIAGIAAAVAAGLAALATRFAQTIVPPDIGPIQWWSGLQSLVLVSAVATLVLSVTFMSYWSAGRAESNARPASTVRGSIGRDWQSLFIALQAASAVVLLAAAASALQEYRTKSDSAAVSQEDALVIGRIKQVLAIGRPQSTYPYDTFARTATSLLEQVKALTNAAVAVSTAFGVADAGDTLTVSSDNDIEQDIPIISVTPEFFRVAAIDVIAGRPFDMSDRLPSSVLRRESEASGDGAIILTQRLSALLFPAENALGRLVRLEDDFVKGRRVVGISQDPPPGTAPGGAATAFVPFNERPSDRLVLLSRVGSKQVSTIRTVVDGFGESIALVSIATAQQERALYLREEAILTRLLTVAGLVALLLTVASIAGAVGLSIAAREQESALRIALGATKTSLVALIVKPFAFSLIMGSTVGALLVVWLSRVSPTTLPTSEGLPLSMALGVGSVLLFGLGCMAMTARRAGRHIASLLRA